MVRLDRVVLLFPLLLLAACGSSPGRPGHEPAAPDAGHTRLHQYVLRYQTGEERFVEIHGETAALWGSDRVDMDSVDVAFYRNNLVFLNLIARAGQARMEAPDSGRISLKEISGRLYYGGRFTASSMEISFGEGAWSARDAVRFDREPLSFRAAAAAGPLSLDRIDAVEPDIRTESASATAAHSTFFPAARAILLEGRALWRTDTETRRAGRMKLRLDPAYSRIVPVDR